VSEANRVFLSVRMFHKAYLFHFLILCNVERIKERKEAMKRKLMLTILPLTILAFSFVAVPPVFGTILNEIIADTIAEPMDLDPAWSYDTSSATLLMNIYETLLWFNRTNMDSYVPVLATDWVGEAIDETSPEGLQWKNRWTFTIRDNSYFHSHAAVTVPGEGAQVTPADIEYTFERMLITDCCTGPAWMIFEPLVGGYWMGDVNSTANALKPGAAVCGPDIYGDYYNVWCDEIVDHTVESNTTHVWFNLVMPYEPWLQIVAQQWGSVLNKEWCVWHGDWPGNIDDSWVDYHDPATSPLYVGVNGDSSSPGPNLDAALGSGPYYLDYWDKGVGNAWSVVKNPAYWRGWTTPYDPPGWGTGFTIGGHVDRYTSNYIYEWSTRRLRFLGGASDFCGVPRMYMGQVLGQPGIECIHPLPQLTCDSAFFSLKVSDTSTHLGVIQAPGTFNEFGAPPDIFEDNDLRLGIAHLFDYDTYLYAAYLDEGISPVTPVVPGLSYYDPNIGKAERPTIDQRKEYGITGEPASQLAYDIDLAVTYLQAAWGGQLWSTGFTMDAVYNEGNLGRMTAAQLIADGLNEINVKYGTKFHVNLVSTPWSTYKLEWKARTLPYFIVGWLADYPDAHNFAHPFMHSTGAFSRWQGILGENSFPNAAVDAQISAGIASLVPSERQTIYTWLQQYYVDFCPGIILTQVTGRHWQADWVEGWYYNPIYPGNYAYDLWKDVGVTVQDVDVSITSTMTEFIKIEIGLPVGDNPVICSCPHPIDVDVARLDDNSAAVTVYVVVGVGLRNETSGDEVIIGIGEATLGYVGGALPSTATVSFDSFLQDPDTPVQAGTYRPFAVVLVQSGYANDNNPANDIFDQASTVEVSTFAGDVNVDCMIDMADISMLIDWFMTYPGHPLWDVRGDIVVDDSVDMADISWDIDLFMVSFC
jgi:peptide/nickel transport system substrate-binding protein